MPVNAGYEYFNAEKKYLAAQTSEEKIAALEGVRLELPQSTSRVKILSQNLKIVLGGW